MAGPRDRRAAPDESRRFTPEGAEECSARLRRRITEVQNPELKSARYDDPWIVTLEKAIRATVADIFGSWSVEGVEWARFRFARQRIARSSNYLRGGGDNSGQIAADMQHQVAQEPAADRSGVAGVD